MNSTIISKINTERWAQDKGERYDKACSLMYVFQATSCDFADTALRDAVRELEKTHHFKQAIKRDARRIIAMLDFYQKELQIVLTEKSQKRRETYEWHLDMLDFLQEAIQPHYFKLRMAINSTLKREGDADADFHSWLVYATNAAHLCSELFKRTMEMYHKNGVFVDNQFTEMNFAPERNLMDGIIDRLIPQQYRTAVENDKQAQLAANIIIRQLGDEKLYNEAGQKALALHPALTEDLNTND